MASPFEIAEHQPVISEETSEIPINASKEEQLQEVMESQPTLFFSLLYELYNRKSTTKDGKRTRRLSKVVSEGGLEDNNNAPDDAPFTWPAVVASLQEVAGDVYILPEAVEPLNQVGEGGFAKVYKAVWQKEGEEKGQLVALKKLKNNNLEPEDLEELIGEANLLRKLNHENVVRFLGMGAQNTESLEAMRSSLFLVQEYVGGGTLKHVILRQSDMKQKGLKQVAYSFEDAFNWLLQIAQALKYLHAQRPIVMHRDLKPENVLLTEGGPSQAVAKLVDFGLHKRIKSKVSMKSRNSAPTVANTNLTQKRVEQLSSHPRRFSDDSAEKAQGRQLLEAFLSADLDDRVHKNDPQLAQISEHLSQENPEVENKLNLASTGALHSVRSQASGRAGSHMYMSPETINGEAYTEKVDVFAFGVLAYELLKGELNVQGLTIEARREGWAASEALSRYARRVARGWREKIPTTWPQEVQDFIQGCWHQDPKTRPKMSAVVNELEELVKNNVSQKMDKKKKKKGLVAAFSKFLRK